MKQGQAQSTAILLVAALLGGLLAMGLFQWESLRRASQSSLFPTQTPLPAPSPSPSTVAVTSATTPDPGAAVGGTRGDASIGAKLFATKCGSCHPGANAGVGPALHGSAFASRYPEDGPLEQVIRKGRGAMPAFADLGDPEMANLIAYMRSLP